MNARQNPDARRRYVAFAKAALVALVVLAASADYVVESGDTLSDIANKHSVSIGALIEANALTNPDLIRPGQVLVIPGQSEGGGGSSYQVAPGDTLHTIASHFGTTVSALIKANQLANPDLLGVGQQLVVPGDDAAPAPVAPAESATHTATTHMVGAGETLAGIAARYGVSVDSIAAANGITDPSVIYVGTTLRLSGPIAPAVTTQPAPGSDHVVSAGESLHTVAASYGVSLTALIETNGIADPNLIRVGQVLSIPAGGTTGSGSAWVCPVAGATYFNDWGFPRSGGRFHQGNDLFAEIGTTVRAPVSGSLQVKTGPVGGIAISSLRE